MAHFFVLDGIVRAWVDETLDFCRSMTLVITSFVMRKSASAPKSAGFGRVTNLATAAVLASAELARCDYPALLYRISRGGGCGCGLLDSGEQAMRDQHFLRYI